MRPTLALRLALAGVLAAAAPAAAAAPQRIVSINLCADQYLLALADGRQIAALSAFAHSPEMSFQYEAARAFPVTRGLAEEVMALGPDLVLAGSFTRRTTRQMLGRLGYRVVALPPPDSFAAARAQLLDVAALVGHSQRGAALAAELDRRLELARAAPPAVRPTALYYQKRGYATGPGTLMHELMRAAGLRDLMAELGGAAVGRVPLETVAAHPPDLLIVDEAGLAGRDRGSEILRHPALARAVPPARRVVVPQRIILCAGPSMPAAVDLLARAAGRLAHGPAGIRSTGTTKNRSASGPVATRTP